MLKSRRSRKGNDMEDWYKENIEAGVRDLVYLLRNNGINTECSCEHEKYIQCQYMTDGSLQIINRLLSDAGVRNYTIDVKIIREDGHLRTMMNIYLSSKFRIPSPERQR